MTDPFEAFVRASASSEVAGFFERAGPEPRADHDAVWFDRAEDHLVVRSAGSLEEVGSMTRRLQGESGVVGYLGFDAVRLVEPALGPPPDSGPFPLGEFARVRTLHRARVPAPKRGAHLDGVRVPTPRSDSLPRSRFGRSVRRLTRAIRDGEAFQVVLAHRREFERPEDLLARARRLRSSERFAFFYYLRFGDREIVGAAPESVVEVRGASATVNPIAGTLPRTSRAGRPPLHADPKELSEHRMLVDLARNDLGRVARAGSVCLDAQEVRERYAAVDHLVSRVSATLRPGIAPWDVLGATFPAGTVSGAPKIRAVELLRREEGTWRGPYGGTVACVRPGAAEFALAIRSVFVDGRRLYTAAGAGVVHQSEPDREYDETIAKLAHVESTMVGETA